MATIRCRSWHAGRSWRSQACPIRSGQRLLGRCLLPFEEWVISHARVAKKPHRAAKLEDTLTFFHQLSTLVTSGTPLLQALKIAATQCESIKLRAILEQITARVASGSTFHSAAAAYPHIFEFQWIEAIRTGEVTGKMAQVLVELNKQIRDSRETKRKVKASLMYPCILICVAVIAVTVMLWMVVPTFAKMFNDMGAKLPAITQDVVDASDFIVAYGLYIIVALVIIIVAFKKFMKTEPGRRYVGGAPHGLAQRGRAHGPDGDVQVRIEPLTAAQERRANVGDDEHRQGNLPERPSLSRCPGTSQRAGRVGQGTLRVTSGDRVSSCRCLPAWSRWARNRASSVLSWSRSPHFTKRRWRR